MAIFNVPVEVFQGYFIYEGTRIDVEFQAPAGATVAEKDAAFMAALAQKAEVNYLAIGVCSQAPLIESEEAVSGARHNALSLRHNEYDAIEIQGVREFAQPNDPEGGSYCEVDNENPQFFSVYAHLKVGGVECVGDFATHVLAAAYAEELSKKYGFQIFDYAN